MCGSHQQCIVYFMTSESLRPPLNMCCCQCELMVPPVDIHAGKGRGGVGGSAGGTCKGNVGSLLDQCNLNNSCFNLEAGQMVIQPGAPLSPWLIGIQQCIKVCSGRPSLAVHRHPRS